MEQYCPPILFVIAEDSVRTTLTVRVQAEYQGAVYSESSANTALHAMSHLYDVGIVVAEEKAQLPSGKHILAAIKEMYPDCRRVILSIGDSPVEAMLEMRDSGEIHDFVNLGVFPVNVLKMLDRQVPIRRELENKRIEVINMASQLNMIALSPSQLNMMLDMHLKNSLAPGAPRNIQKLTRHIRSLWDTERRRLAADIHDELGQKLTAIQLGVSTLMYHPFPVDALPEMQLILEQLGEMHTSVRGILGGLRSESLETLGLIPAIRQLCSNTQKISGINCALTTNIEKISIIDLDIVDNIYRIIQESVNNAVKHAEAKNINISITQPTEGNHIETMIIDDGIGINLDNIDFTPGYGILGMRERAESFGGALEIVSNNNGPGTKVVLVAPQYQN